MVKRRKNKDFFANCKSMAFWALRMRFEATYRAAVEIMPYNPDDLISIDPQLPELLQLQIATVTNFVPPDTVGKIVIDKMPDGASSTNLADAVNIALQPELSLAHSKRGSAWDEPEYFLEVCMDCARKRERCTRYQP